MADHRGGRQDRPLLAGVRAPTRSPTRPGSRWPIVIEEMCWGDAGIALAIFGTTLAVAGIVGNGTPEQIGEWVPQCFGTPDKIQLGAFCVSEPDAGSDVSSLRTRAVYDEAKDEWVLNGTKTWITNGGIADVHVVVGVGRPRARRPRPGQLRRAARHAGPQPGPEVQEARHPRVPHRRGRPRRRAASPARACSAARRSSTTGSPGRARAEAAGVQAAMTTFEATRPLVGAQAIGIARAAYEYALDYAKERRQFGRPIIENQAIAFKLADMKTEIDAARLLVWRAAWMARNGKQFDERRGLDVQAQGRRDRGVGRPSGPSRSSAATATCASTRSSAGTATRRSTTSSKAPREIQRLVIARAISGLHIE